MVTVGQRRGIGLPGGGPKRYVVDIDHETATVVVGDEAICSTAELRVGDLVVGRSTGHVGDVLVQCSAHGAATRRVARRVGVTAGALARRRSVVSPPAQSVVFYDDTDATCSVAASPGEPVVDRGVVRLA